MRTTGWLTVVAADERFALARIDYACVTVESGDYLEPYAEPAVPTTPQADGPPNFSDMSRVLFGVDRHEAFGAGDLLSIDRGQSQGMTVGTRVAFYRDRMIGTPLYELGAGVVIEVSAETSKVAVERAAPEIKAGDYVVDPADAVDRAGCGLQSTVYGLRSTASGLRSSLRSGRSTVDRRLWTVDRD